MGYRVQFKNLETGEGYIDHYNSATRAKLVVERCQARYREAGSGIWATYLGLAGTKLAERLQRDREAG